MPSAEEMSSSLDEEASLLFGVTADELESFLSGRDTLISLSLTFIAFFTLAFPENLGLIGGNLSVIPPFCRNQRA